MAEAHREITIGARFNGPPGSGNGGYTAGLVAAALGAERSGAVVTLRQPPPLERPMRAVIGDGAITVYDGDTLVAEGVADPKAALEGEPVPPASLEEAVRVSHDYPGFTDHPFPTCFVCGPGRPERDGLGIFPGPLPDGRTAAPWTAPADVTPVTVWASLDCPGGWAIIAPGRPYVLGRMAARVEAVPSPGDRCVVTGQVLSVEGRKAMVATALYAPDGTLLARARATWIAI